MRAETDFEKAEEQWRALRIQYDKGSLDKDGLRVEVAKLLLRDRQGTFWMLDAEDGRWYRNEGDGWLPGDPRRQWPPEEKEEADRRTRGRRLILVTIPLLLLAVAGALILAGRLPFPQRTLTPTPEPGAAVPVTIASPAEDSQIAFGQEVGIEATLSASPDLEAVARVELQVGEEIVQSQLLGGRIQAGQGSLPVSLPWRPPAVGEYVVAVIARSAGGESLGTARIRLYVAQASEETLPEPACTLQAALLSHVTIPAGTAFPPGARMDKVWQVRNSGTCAWGVGYELAQVDGQSLGAQGPVAVPPTAAGERSNLEMVFWAPTETGSYTSTWQLRSPQGEFFGPLLTIDVQVEVLAEKELPPLAPANAQATLEQDGKSVRLTWQDRSDNEDAFRIYRDDVEASIGLVPADVHLFVDRTAACGTTYLYGVAAFNAAGTSSLAGAAPISLPPCAPSTAPPTLILAIVPPQIQAGEVFTVVFQAEDDAALAQVTVRGQGTGDPLLDEGQVFECSEAVCAGSWPLSWTGAPSTTVTFVAVARDSAGQESEAASADLDVRPGE